MNKEIPYLKITIAWLCYTVCLLLAVLFMATGGYIKVLVDFKELVFAIWGYGWDGAQYIEIATKGYRFPNQAYFPLYPLIIFFTNTILPLTISYRINLIISLVLLIGLYITTQYLDISKEDKFKAVLVFLFFPTSFYLQANYADTLLILLSCVSLIFLLNKKYFYAALLCGLATGVKPNGAVLAIVILIAYFYDQVYAKLKIEKLGILKVLKGFGLGVISIAGILSYFLYLNYFNKGYQIFFKAQSEWGRGKIDFLQIPSLLIWSYTNFFNQILNPGKFFLKDTVEILALTFLVIFLLILSFRKIPKELYLFSLGNVILPLASGTTLSLGRFSLICFPLILFFSKYLKTETSFALYIFISTVLQILLVGFFFSGRFVG